MKDRDHYYFRGEVTPEQQDNSRTEHHWTRKVTKDRKKVRREMRKHKESRYF